MVREVEPLPRSLVSYISLLPILLGLILKYLMLRFRPYRLQNRNEDIYGF
jgi:hypothetical protein